ncbi:SMI1/KNR4 family protein [Synechococcus sp. PCC 7336]|uniref:SMI1/KNR4 family protein n=1 Tax=Synechococcus sp. PCC 7336 TaxID=195250 RepID=UPI00036C6956|nr:SMI1/KNR4 family protein [Synechococcus sp. PCC 7336]
MINNINDLKEKLISRGIAQEYQLVGCSPQELIQIEEKYGQLPTSYKQIMELLGRRAGKLVDRYEFDFYIDQIIKLNEDFLNLIQDEIEETGLSKNIFLICSRYGSNDEFILTEDGEDSPVFAINDNGDVKQRFQSIWEWIESFIEDSIAIMKLQQL